MELPNQPEEEGYQKTKLNTGWWPSIFGITILVASFFFFSSYPIQTVLVYVAYFAFAKNVWWPVVLIGVFAFMVGVVTLLSGGLKG